MGLSGSTLIFLHELTFVTGEDIAVEVDSAAVSYQTLIERVHQQYPGTYIKTIITGNPDEAYKFYWHKGSDRFEANVNQYTGEVLRIAPADEGLMSLIYDFHISLLISPWGDLILAITSILFLISSLTGLWTQRKFLLSVFKTGIRKNKSTKTIFSDTHKLTGTLALITNFIIGVTAFYITLHVYDPEFYNEGRSRKTEFKDNNYPFSLDSLVLDAEKRIKDFRVSYISFPRKPADNIFFSSKTDYGNFIFTPYYGTASAEYNYKSGELASTFDLRIASFKEKFNNFMFEFHYGKYAGVFVKIIYLIAGLMPVVLAITGLFIWRLKQKNQI